jgi:hypothetical protein
VGETTAAGASADELSAFLNDVFSGALGTDAVVSALTG